jgi:hypothetical protein
MKININILTIRSTKLSPEARTNKINTYNGSTKEEFDKLMASKRELHKLKSMIY